MVSSHLSVHRENLCCWMTVFRQKGRGLAFPSQSSQPLGHGVLPKGRAPLHAPWSRHEFALLPRPTSSGRARAVSDGAGSGRMEKYLKLLLFSHVLQNLHLCLLAPWAPVLAATVPEKPAHHGLWKRGLVGALTKGQDSLRFYHTSAGCYSASWASGSLPSVPVLPALDFRALRCTLHPCPMCPTELTPVLRTRGAQDKPQDPVHPSSLVTAIEEPKAQF